VAVASFTCFGAVLSCSAMQQFELISGRQSWRIASSGLFTAGLAFSSLGLAVLTGELTSRRVSRSDPTPPPLPHWPGRG